MNSKQKKTILLVEDDLVASIYTAKIVGEFGYYVVTAFSGEEAVEIALRNNDINLIIMDIDLGDGIDGTEAAEKILKIRDIPVVFLSSHDEPEIVEKTQNITSYGYVLKNSSGTVLDVSIKMAFRLFEANRKTVESEERYRTLVENQLEVVCVWLPDTTLTFVNESYCSLVGKSKEELIGKKWIDYIPEEARPEVLANYKNAISTKQVYSYIHEVEGVVGVRWYSWNDVPLFDAQGNLIYYQSVGHDITERKKIEDALEEKRLFQKTLIDSIPAPMFYKDADGRYLGFNRAYLEFYGKTESELVGKTVYDIAPKEFADRYFAADRELFDNPGTQIYESQIIDARGQMHDVIFHKATFNDYRGRLSGLIGVILDISDRKKAEETLSLNNIILNAQSEVSIDGLLIVDSNNKILFYNKLFTDIWNIPDEILESKSDDLVLEHVLDKLKKPDEFIKKIRHVYEVMDKSRDEIRLIDGRILDRYSAPVILPDGKYYGRAWYFRDITERKQSENDLIIAVQNSDIFREKAEQATQEKELLLKEVHHRIKNNMNTITGLLHLQADTMKEDRAAAGALNDAANRVQSMTILYDKLYRSIEFKKMSIRDYFTTLLDEILINFPNSVFVKLEKNIDDILISSKILSSLGIILNELITNIMKYAFTGRKDGFIKVDVHAAEPDSAGGSTNPALTQNGTLAIRMEITDNGVGMPESVDMGNSSGFGLKLVNMLVKQIGGYIKIEKEKGTRFTIDFRVKKLKP